MTEARSSGVLRIIPLLITIYLLSFPACAKYSGGNETVDNPDQIVDGRTVTGN